MKEIVYNNKRFKPVSCSEYFRLTSKENVFKELASVLTPFEIELYGGLEQAYNDLLKAGLISNFIFNLSFIHLWPILRKQNTFTEEVYLFDYLGTI